MKTIFRLTMVCIALLICSVNSNGAKVRRVKYTADPNKLLYIDSIDYRKDLTRLYGKLIERPHGTIKIESVTGATDIDGLDFGRWAIYDEKGIIQIEIDFGAKKHNAPFEFIIKTDKGELKYKIIK